MNSIRIWAPESDTDTDSKAVRCIAEKIVSHYGSDFRILEGTKEAFNQASRQPDGLVKAVNTYLKSSRLVIFLLDADGVQSQAKRKEEPNSLINKVTRAVQQSQGKAVLVLIQQELEAWLLVDCLGVCCFFTKDSKIREKQKWVNFSKKNQAGKTNLITEAELGGKNAKEHLVELSKKILKVANPKLKPSDITQNQYSEQISDQVAKCIEITQGTLIRNDSLLEFSQHLKPPEENSIN
ncbi:MAG: hypothetical protein DCF22_13505 [Leptolyngbya sp.]|nr:MAG: hypothetical protein DCF22_13505 [Leptolyngbya sp.]